VPPIQSNYFPNNAERIQVSIFVDPGAIGVWRAEPLEGGQLVVFLCVIAIAAADTDWTRILSLVDGGLQSKFGL
jgi:hypothetical protein